MSLKYKCQVFAFIVQEERVIPLCDTKVLIETNCYRFKTPVGLGNFGFRHIGNI